MLVFLNGSSDLALSIGCPVVCYHSLTSSGKDCRCVPGVQGLPGKLGEASCVELGIFFSAG